MTLVLTITNVERLDNGEPTQLRLDRHGALIGRSPHSDWSLPDPNNYVSSSHCEIDYREGAYSLVDKSTNGTFLNGSDQRLAGAHVLKDGDIIAIGHYQVAVGHLGGASAAPAAGAGASPPASSGAGDGWGGWGGAPAAQPPPAFPGAGWETATSGRDAPAATAAGSGWGEVAAPAPEPASTWANPTDAGRSSGWGAADPVAAAGWGVDVATGPAPWGAPAPAANAAPAPAPVPPASGWSAPASPPAPSPPALSWGASADAPVATPAVTADSAWGAAGAGPAKPLASGWDAIAPARSAQGASVPGAGGEASPITGRGGLSQSWAPPRVDTPDPAAPSNVDVWGAMAASNVVDWSRGGFGEAPATPPPGPAGATDDVWPALLRAAGLAPGDVRAEPAEAAAAAGSLLKRLVAGLVVMMEARARAKAQLGAQSTSLELKGNNPLKFARSPERVLAQLLGAPERGFMGAGDAVEDSFRDLQAHQMATLAAMQGALRATLDRFSPKAIRQRAEMRGVLARILPGARNAALWEAYEREFEGVAKSSDEAFMDVFAKAFKEAYETAAAQMKAQAPPR